ncbi:dsrm domain-containing protein [Cephalotus follicularis]|uniref:Dsrm domain-containing protein n=1 Tax=Cephalotus follicularis TaxID=3775 RepID=A0A1Q3CB26_CEPFO|nr:dsrm domain-containing protein [Cephalotus follicularis]
MKMYKSKLQELCQQRGWRLPEYSTDKQGLDHCPTFEATVAVNGFSFKTPSPFRSSKGAQNEAAKLAFLHFSSSLQPPASLGSSSANDSGCNLLNRGPVQLRPETNPIPYLNVTACVLQEDRLRDVQHLYKNQLQNYAQKRNLTLPLYTCERDGPPHASRFKCKVTVDGKTFENPEFFSTIKEAEHAVARIALVSLLQDGVQEDDPIFYKNLLQELAQKEGYLLPTYSTEKSGEAHRPSFVSTVEVGGQVFTGQEAKTKKQAEMSAAKAAYVKLTETKLSQIPTILSSSCQGQGACESSSSGLHTDISGFPQPSFGAIAPDSFASSRIPEEQAENRESVFASPPEIIPSDRTRIIVYPSVANMTFPANSNVLPYSNDKWVAVKISPQSNQKSI